MKSLTSIPFGGCYVRVRDVLRTGIFFSWVRGEMGVRWGWRFFRRRARGALDKFGRKFSEIWK